VYSLHNTRYEAARSLSTHLLGIHILPRRGVVLAGEGWVSVVGVEDLVDAAKEVVGAVNRGGVAAQHEDVERVGEDAVLGAELGGQGVDGFFHGALDGGGNACGLHGAAH